MNQLPEWWIAITGGAAVVIALFFLVMIILLIVLIKVMLSLQKPITGLVNQVNDLVPTVKNLVQKVEDLTGKVEGIADSTRKTVDDVGGKAKGIATSVEHISAIASQRMSQFAPILGTLMAGMRIYNVYRQFRTAQEGDEHSFHKGKKKSGTKIDLGEAPRDTIVVK